MKPRRRTIRRLRALALALAACVALAVPAAAEPGADYPQPSSAKIGDTPADFAQPVAPAAKSGDTPADFPGTSDTSGTGKISEPPPTLIAVPDTGGFDWISAAIGAGGAGVLIVVSMSGIALTSRRR
jgi:hypothetical protein